MYALTSSPRVLALWLLWQKYAFPGDESDPILALFVGASLHQQVLDLLEVSADCYVQGRVERVVDRDVGVCSVS